MTSLAKINVVIFKNKGTYVPNCLILFQYFTFHVYIFSACAITLDSLKLRRYQLQHKKDEMVFFSLKSLNFFCQQKKYCFTFLIISLFTLYFFWLYWYNAVFSRNLYYSNCICVKSFSLISLICLPTL